MTTATLSAAWRPPRARAFKPKAMDSGQAVTWSLVHDGYYVTSAGERRYDAADHTWIDGWTEERTGVIWSEGNRPNMWFVIPDGTRAPVVIFRQGKKGSLGLTVGQLYEDERYPSGYWSRLTRAAENVRTRGIFPVISEESAFTGRYGSYARVDPRSRRVTVMWHTDHECPEAAGKPVYRPAEDTRPYGSNGGELNGYRCPDSWAEAWTPATVADVILGRRDIASTGPFCTHCIMPKWEA